MKATTNNQVLLSGNKGFTLIELVIIILVIGVLATVAIRKMTETVESAAYEQTKAEMAQLAQAIVGNPQTYTLGAQAEFGYVGDVGALPATLTNLATNPGLATWDGPYIGGGFNTVDYRQDGWGVDYDYTGLMIRSTGSGAAIEKLLAPAVQDILGNTVSGSVVDANRMPPNNSWRDSIAVQLIVPNGTGGYAVRVDTLDSDGRFLFGGVPIGNHRLRLIYHPRTDTMTYTITVLPGRESVLDIVAPADLW